MIQADWIVRRGGGAPGWQMAGERNGGTSFSTCDSGPCVSALPGVRSDFERSLGATLDLLTERPTELELFEVADEAQRNADFALQMLDSAGQVECRAGCSACCHRAVQASVPEVLLIAQHVRERFSDVDLARLFWTLVERAGQRAGRSPVEWAARRLPCPLLADDRCSVYEFRPLACRGAASFDAARCDQAWRLGLSSTSLPTSDEQARAAAAVGAGLLEALGRVGLDDRPVDLAAALRLALEQPDAAERWLAGESVFEPAAPSSARRSHTAA